MRSEASRKIICIHITTYRPRYEEMDEKVKNCFKGHNKYVCSICLNKGGEKNGECCKKAPKNCPICQKNRECTTRDCSAGKKDKPTATEKAGILKDPNVKTVQTSDTNVSQGLTLLNEVLTVFQNKKVDGTKEKVKPGRFKDAAVSTDDKTDERSVKERDRPRLTVSTFQYSIDENKKYAYENGHCVIVNCCQPDFVRKQNSIDLIKHKSSSIPQMKLEELKYSLKEKTKSKDAIEEVNRLFATVKRPGKMSENSNRPMVRNGPRVLPVVNSNYHDVVKKKNFGVECNVHSCKCCHTCMSSGDAFPKNECCHDENEKCEKCVYMLCCHYESVRKRQKQNGVLICEHCRDMHEGHFFQHNYVDDST
ncbi:uncharacterized protein LOC110384653 [Helicoverpa armigera]|uniref:uncharacterized protein LOC110384653 n=1 Tax=Helicoverpa armigera TaxID=29058 RepID=UPI000B395C89|nr:uncharacterized protein LOC110384653 [Helicoverpa armigera]PZC84798.1 hypothetical protein B5X24_HaOG203788 [Helicoverpa armigera]